MIKIITSDIDGTLLAKGEEEVSDTIKNTINLIKSKGIIFAVATGRQYEEAYKILRGISNIYYICSDGGCIIYNNEIIFKKSIDKITLKCFNNSNNVFYHSPFNTYRELCDDDIVKVSAYGGGFYEAPFGTYEVYRDKSWREWIKNGAGKGQAVEFLQNNLKISVKETAAIGDNYNDMGMFRRAGERYCMSKAPDRVKLLCNKITDDIEIALKEIGGIQI